jgi:hypothetical protein
VRVLVVLGWGAFRLDQAASAQAPAFAVDPDGTFVRDVCGAKNIKDRGDRGRRVLARRAAAVFYVADGMSDRICILDRQSLEVLTRFGDGGRQPAQFYGVQVGRRSGSQDGRKRSPPRSTQRTRREGTDAEKAQTQPPSCG